MEIMASEENRAEEKPLQGEPMEKGQGSNTNSDRDEEEKQDKHKYSIFTMTRGSAVLQNVPWGESALSSARDVVLQFDDVEVHSFLITPPKKIEVRLAKISKRSGLHGKKVLDKFRKDYGKILKEKETAGEMPVDVDLEVMVMHDIAGWLNRFRGAASPGSIK